MRTLVIGDIHGGYKALLQVFERAKVTLNDKLVFLGDYVDGWSESAELVEYLIHLNKKQDCVFIRGNHDLWCDLWLNKGASNPIWQQHGGKETVVSYIYTGYVTSTEHKKFFSEMKNYYVDSANRLFLHAGYTSEKGIGYEEFESAYYFDRSLWTDALNSVVKEIEKPSRLNHFHEIYIGHTPTINYGSLEPMKAQNVWNVDTGAAFKGKLTVLDIDTKEFWQSETVYTLYPNEKGRN